MLYNVLLIIQILVALAIIGLVLIQHGKGADAGAAFGGGASGTVFGARGSGTFLTKLTAILATVFFANSLMLAWLVSHPDDIVGESIVPTEVSEPASTVDLPKGSGDVVPATENKAPSDIPK
ncbi:MAG: preprotein translocase subunit SecG [Thiotrichales bacterium]|nr:MAG: preprotein translocase subunit SecG [Thiotrichales bacterium]